MLLITESVNVLELYYNGCIVLKWQSILYSPLSSYLYIYGILDFKYILLLRYVLIIWRS